MLINVPDPNSLNRTALRLYFEAWTSILDMLEMFLDTYPSEVLPWEGSYEWLDEWNEFQSDAQEDLAAIQTKLQQAAEIRLKCLIALQSPYALLLNGEVRFKETSGDVDFIEQRTLDAVDLPGAVLCLTDFDLHSNYIQSYHSLRKLRNKETHIGTGLPAIEVENLVTMFGSQYRSLWPDRNWLANRLKNSGKKYMSYFHDGRWSSEYTSVMHELDLTMRLFSNADFKRCFGYKKSALKGCCPQCRENMASKVGDLPETTAVQLNQTDAICLLCQSELIVGSVEKPCDCSCTDTLSDLEGNTGCFSCGMDNN